MQMRASMQRRLFHAGYGFSRQFIAASVEFLFPRACVTCHLPLAPLAAENSAVDQFCADCRRTLTEGAEQPACLRCGAAVGPHVDSANGCLECRRDRFAFQKVFRLGIYQAELREAVIRCKYLTHEPLLMGLGELIWDYRGSSMQTAGIDLVVPIPQHWRQRLFSRHHAPEVLAETLARRLQVPVANALLVKVRPTLKQAHLNRTERHENQQGVFRVTRREAIAGKRVLLVDDVLTTGATAHSASSTLRSAGAANVMVGVIARALSRN